MIKYNNYYHSHKILSVSENKPRPPLKERILIGLVGLGLTINTDTPPLFADTPVLTGFLQSRGALCAIVKPGYQDCAGYFAKSIYKDLFRCTDDESSRINICLNEVVFFLKQYGYTQKTYTSLHSRDLKTEDKVLGFRHTFSSLIPSHCMSVISDSQDPSSILIDHKPYLDPPRIETADKALIGYDYYMVFRKLPI